MHPQAHEKNITLELDVPASLAEAEVDGDWITQVIRNLVSNALRHTPSNGRVNVGAQESNGKVEISIADNGMGIEPEDLPHVFDRFYRAAKSQGQAREGSGLGLAIVKRLVEAHGGQVGVESQLGISNCFIV